MEHTPYAKNDADVHALLAVLNQLAVGNLATYDDLSAAIGREIREHRYLLDKALSECLKQRKVFGCVTGVGVKRLSDTEIVEHSFHAFRRIRRMARKGAARLSSVDWNTMPDDEKKRHNLYISVLGAICHSATPKNMGRVAASCANGNKNGMPTAKTLALLAT